MSLLYGRIDRVLWRSSPFRRRKPNAKLVYLALLSGPDGTTLPGLVSSDASRLCGDTGLSMDDVDVALQELIEAKMIAVDDDNCMVAILDAPAPTADEANPKTLTGWWNCWTQLPASDLKVRHVSALMAACNLTSEAMYATWARTFGSVSDAFAIVRAANVDASPSVRSSTGDPSQIDRHRITDRLVIDSSNSNSSSNSKEATALAPATAGAGGAIARKPRAKQPRPPAEPMPFTIAELLTALASTSKGQFVVDPFDSAFAKPLTVVIRSMHEAKCTLDDVRLAGEYAAVFVPRWNTGEPLGLNWIATGGRLVTMIGKARQWHANGRQAPPLGRPGAQHVDAPRPVGDAYRESSIVAERRQATQEAPPRAQAPPIAAPVRAPAPSAPAGDQP